MKNETLKWAAIQPLTGGMYLGAEKFLGHPAEFILTFPKFADPKYDKEGNVSTAGNEYHLLSYLKKKNRLPNVKIFNRAPFKNDMSVDVELMNHDLWTTSNEINLNDIDVVVAVPVCSGLSTATRATQEVLDERNSNMLWIAHYALKKIQPKIYIFENAPTFWTERGDRVRQQFEELAKETDYSIAYYKTDTKYHDNCQKRPRTFIIFFKKDYCPKMNFEHIEVDAEEYLSRIPENASQQIPLSIRKVNFINEFCINYLKEQYGDDWREIAPDPFKYIVANDLFDKIVDFALNRSDGEERHKESLIHFFSHAKEKLSQGKGFYHSTPAFPKDGKIASVMFKMMERTLHPKEDRLFTCRELLHLMGMPDDFELQGDFQKEYRKIGQNVPMRTAYWIVKAAIEAYDTENDLNEKKRIRWFDNTKMEERI